jgi:hypothetical protein
LKHAEMFRKEFGGERMQPAEKWKGSALVVVEERL